MSKKNEKWDIKNKMASLNSSYKTKCFFQVYRNLYDFVLKNISGKTQQFPNMKSSRITRTNRRRCDCDMIEHAKLGQPKN